jgi:uridine kinase
MRLPAGVVLIAGPSGSGKSFIARRTGLPVLHLDDFYKDSDDPTLPRTNNRIDWESPSAWDAAEAVRTITQLARDGRAEVPVYAISADRRVGTRVLELNGSPLFIAEGIFAAEIQAECRSLGLLAGAYALRRPRALTFVRRLIRDLAERRKPAHVVIRRSLHLLRTEPQVLRRQTELGCRPAGGSEILREVAALAAAATRRASNGSATEATTVALPDQLRVGRLDHIVDDLQPLVERDERALHRVDGEPLQVTPAVPERLDQ